MLKPYAFDASAEPQIEILSDSTLAMIHPDGSRFEIEDSAWVARIRRAIASGDAMPNVIRNGREA